MTKFGGPFNSETGRLAKLKQQAEGKVRGKTPVTLLVRELHDPEKAKAAFRRLEDMAVAGDMPALKLYLAYVFGMPTITINQTNAGEITIIRDGNTYPQIRASSSATDDITEAETL